MLPRFSALVHGLCLTSSAFAQLALPSTPWLPPAASSGAQPSNSTSTPNPQWRNLLGDLLYFYECQRSGKLPSTNRVGWRNDSALDDGKDVGLDLTGGYYDAGDYVKFTFPLSFTLTSICWGALDAGKGYDSSNQTAYLDSMIRWGLDWLVKAHPLSNTLFVQVGDSNLDNAYWGGDANIPSFRPSYQINDTSPGTDVAAGVSAAFSSCAALYSGANLSYPVPSSAVSPGHAQLQNKTYASTLLSHAKDLYAFALNATGGQVTYQTSVPASGDAYGSSGYTDEIVLATLFLGLAENDTATIEHGQQLYRQYNLSAVNNVFNWDSKTPGLPVLGAQLAQAGMGGNKADWQADAEKNFDAILAGTGRAFTTKGGLLWYDGDSDDASLNPALNMAMIMARYAPLATTSEKTSSYLRFARSQLDYVLGDNPRHISYVVGLSPNSPINPHSALASGGNDISQIDSSPEQETYILYGGVVGGPTQGDKFYDIRSDWPETEVALDYVAPLLTLAALSVANNTAEDPFYTSLKEDSKRLTKGKPCDAVFPCSPKLPRVAEIVIGVIVGVVGLAIVGFWLCYAITLFRSRSTSTAAKE